MEKTQIASERVGDSRSQITFQYIEMNLYQNILMAQKLNKIKNREI